MYKEIGFYDDNGNIWWIKRKDVEGLKLQELLKSFWQQFC